MKLPSLDSILNDTTAVARQFPLECLVTLIGTVAAFIFVHTSHETSNLLRIILTTSLALPTFLALNLRRRYLNLSNARVIIEHIVAVLILLTFYFLTSQESSTSDIIRYVLLNVAAHLFVAFGGFISRGSTSAFWQFNKELFLRIITAIIFSVVLFAGLAGALASLQALFGLEIDGEVYGKTAILIFGLFQTLFFLAGVPLNEERLEEMVDFPKILKVFTQYVLLPLVCIYLLILLSYEGKILFEGSLPKGWVSNLIIAYGIAGILSILLVHPIREDSGNKWIKIFGKWFYLLMIPLLILMWVAIGRRVYDYGFTLERVIVVGLSLWLTLIAVWFSIRPHSDIRIIPISLAIMALLVCLSAWEISKRSQRHELKALFSQHELIKGNEIIKANPSQMPSDTARTRMTSIIRYLLEFHGPESVSPWLKYDGAVPKNYQFNQSVDTLMMNQLGFLGLESYEISTQQAENHWYQFNSSGAISLRNADWAIPFGNRRTEEESGMHLKINYPNSTMRVYDSGKAISEEINPRPLLEELIESHGSIELVDIEEMKQRMSTKDYEFTVYYNDLHGSTSANNVSSFSGLILIWEKER